MSDAQPQRPAALARRIAALGIEIDPEKVRRVEELNSAALHGAILLARLPEGGPVVDALAGWQEELNELSGGRLRFNPGLHLAEASLTHPPHLTHPLSREDLDHLDLSAFLGSLENARPVTVRLARAYLDPDGNLVVAGRSEDWLEALRESWRRAGLWIKGHPAVEGARCTVHATLCHLPLPTWTAMTDSEVADLARWVSARARLEPPLELRVDELRVTCMNRRSGRSVLGDDIVLPLGRPADTTAELLQHAILRLFASGRTAVPPELAERSR